MKRHRIGLCIVALLLAGCTRKPDDGPRELLVFAAVSLRDAMGEIAKSYEDTHPRTTVSLSFAGSNALALQIIAAPRADVFCSASEEWMDRVERAGALVAGSRRALLGNQLVVVAHRESTLHIGSVCDLVGADFERLALGDPGAVPAGIYAKQYLASTVCADGRSAWTALEPKLVSTPNVRAALAQVEASRNAIGIVYRTTAAASKRVRVLHVIADERAPDIVYPVALVRDHAGSEPRRFLQYLDEPAARAVFERYGFRVLPARDVQK